MQTRLKNRSGIGASPIRCRSGAIASKESMASTTVSRIVRASRSAIYTVCLDPAALARWRVPDNMTAEIHEFHPHVGGTYRMSLTYIDPSQSPGGKTNSSTDTFTGRFVELVPDRRIVEQVEFVSSDPRFAGQMTTTTSLDDDPEGTRVTILCEGIPSGIRPEDNELGCTLALRNLARLVER